MFLFFVFAIQKYILGFQKSTKTLTVTVGRTHRRRRRRKRKQSHHVVYVHRCDVGRCFSSCSREDRRR